MNESSSARKRRELPDDIRWVYLPLGVPGLLVRGKYRVWFDVHSPTHRVRWARQAKPDDGIGIQTHGGSPSLMGAIAAARAHDDQYRALRS